MGIRVDPIALVVDEAFGIVPSFARRYDTAIDSTRRAIELDASYWQAYTWLGLALAVRGLFPEVIEALETAWKLDNSPTIAEFLGGIYARGDYTDKALEMIEELSRQAEYRFVCPSQTSRTMCSATRRARFWWQLGHQQRMRQEKATKNS